MALGCVRQLKLSADLVVRGNRAGASVPNPVASLPHLAIQWRSGIPSLAFGRPAVSMWQALRELGPIVPTNRPLSPRIFHEDDAIDSESHV